MLHKLFPHPYLTALLTVIWLMLVNQFKLGSLIFGFALGTIIPLITAAYWPDRPLLRNPLAIAGYVLIVLYDIVKSAISVAMIVLFKPVSELESAWITVPLELRTPEAITVLAGTITMTPGTVTADISACGRALLVHCLHAPDPDSVRDDIKARYEARLMRIFE